MIFLITIVLSGLLYLIFMKRFKKMGLFETIFLRKYGKRIPSLENVYVSNFIFKSHLVLLYRQYFPLMGNFDRKIWSTFESRLLLQIHLNLQALRENAESSSSKIPTIIDSFRDLVDKAQKEVSGIENMSTFPAVTSVSKPKPKDFNELSDQIAEFTYDYVKKQKDINSGLIYANNILAEIISSMMCDYCQRIKPTISSTELQDSVRKQWSNLLQIGLDIVYGEGRKDGGIES